MNYYFKQEAGFTMVELLVAISILVIVLLPLTEIFMANTAKIAAAKQLTIATNLARLKLEEQRVKDFADISSRSLAEIGEKDFVDYKYSVEVINIKEKVKEVIVKVYFKDDFEAELLTFIRDI